MRLAGPELDAVMAHSHTSLTWAGTGHNTQWCVLGLPPSLWSSPHLPALSIACLGVYFVSPSQGRPALSCPLLCRQCLALIFPAIQHCFCLVKS